jgi:hypothetical protein
VDGPVVADLDWDPPLAILEALATRTGTRVGELRLRTCRYRPFDPPRPYPA